MLIGYARVSTEDQRLDLQREALIRCGVDPEDIYEDKISGTKSDRPGLKLALARLRPGDKLVVWRLDRLGRSIIDLITLMTKLKDMGVEFQSLTEAIDTETAGGRLIFHMMAALAEFERNLISERTKAGLQAAKNRGWKPGRKRKLKPEQVEMMRKMLDDGHLPINVARFFKVSKPTMYRNLAGQQDGDDDHDE